MAGVRQDVDAERGRVAAVPLRADPEAVGAIEQVLLERVELRVRVRRAELAEQRLLGEDRRFFKGAAHADAQDERRARVGPRRLDALDDPLLHAGDALGGCEHLVLRPVLAATALGHDHDPERRTRADVDMDDGGRVVAGVHAIERRADDRGAEVPLPVALPHAVVDGVVEATPGDVDVLAELDEADDEARVLAVGDAPGPCHLGVLLQDLEHLLPGRRPLPPERPVEGPQHVGLEVEVRLDAELLDRVGDRADVDVPHGRPTSSAGPSTR